MDKLKGLDMDVAEYRQKIRQINEKLAELPDQDQLYNWQERRRVEKKRRSLIQDIEHNERLIRIAERGQD